MEKKYWKSQGILSVRKNGNHCIIYSVTSSTLGFPVTLYKCLIEY